MSLKMNSLELDSLEDNTLNNNNSDKTGDKNCNIDSFKYCLKKSNGFHCMNKVILHEKNDFCALTLLDLSNSDLTSIPIEINDLKNLLILNISHNNVDKIGVNLSNNLLSKLIASFNRLSIDQNLINRIIESFPSLTDLNLSYQLVNDKNELETNETNATNECNKLDLKSSQLKYMNLSGNQLSRLSHLNGSTSLHTIILHTNHMSTLPLFRCCQQLQVLDISNNCFDEQLLTGNNLDILFNNCPSLRHLDMIGSGGFNARNVINRSQYLTVPVSEKLIHFVDIGSVSQCQIAISNSFINSSVCVEALSESELIVGLVNGTKFAPIIKSNFSQILETELNCIETKKDYLKNSILSMFRLLSDKKCENLENVNIIVSHLKFDPIAHSMVVKLASYGQRTTLRQVPMSATEANNNNNSRSPKIINLCSKVATNTLNKPLVNGLRDQSFIADPICHELTLTASAGLGSDNDLCALLMGINIVDHEEESISELFASKHLMTLTDKLKRFTEVINSQNNYLNNCDSCDNHCFGANFLAVAIHPKIIEENSNRCEEESSLKSSSSNTSDTNDSEHSEKYRSWEYILEENHKCLFKKELEALKDVDANKFDSICSRKLKSSQTPIISLQQFITRSEKLNKKYDTNTFKVYKI